MPTFQEMGLKPEVLNAISEMGFEHPTSIQAKAIPHLLSSTRDLIGRAQTGTGKTGAFGLPIVNQLNLKSENVQALILCPTRELCIQITNELQNFSQNLKQVRVIPVYGGASANTQIFALKNKGQIVVGTPGRTLDLINRKKLKVDEIRWLVLDEADEMLSMGFKDDLDAILATTPREKQTLLFSATLPPAIMSIVRTYMDKPEEIAAEKVQTGADNVTHHFYEVHARDRYIALKRILDMHPNIYAIVFCRTRAETKEIAEKLSADGYNSDALHGDLSQEQREYTMTRFRSKSLQLLIATDVAARGLDVSDLTHVINYNLPDDPDTYIHRSGRTGRAHRKGISISIIHSKEHGRIRDIERRVGKPFEKKRIPTGQEICGKQLFALIDRVENVDVDETQIKDHLPVVFQKLSWLDREELIKRFVSIEFNRFLAYYKDSKDINVEPGRRDERTRGARDERPQWGGREDRGKDKWSASTGPKTLTKGDRKDTKKETRGSRETAFSDEANFDWEEGKKQRVPRADGKPEPAKRGADRPKVKFASLVVNQGQANKFNPKVLLSLINTYMPDQEAQIGKIDVQFTHTIFDVDEVYKDQVIKAFKKAKYRGYKLTVDELKPKKGK